MRAQALHMLSIAQRAAQGEFASLAALRAAVHEQAKQIKLALTREAMQLAGKECAPSQRLTILRGYHPVLVRARRPDRTIV